ncbi:excisionase [Salinisphaera sp. USBA-960]|nr:excisionase [Salifodinibacter halophilus]
MDTKPDYAFGSLVEECAKRGIGRTVAFELAKDGTIETFNIGRRRYVKLASLDTLPERVQQSESGRAS